MTYATRFLTARPASGSMLFFLETGRGEYLPKPLDAVANMPAADLDLADISDDEIEEHLAALKAHKAELECRKAELERNIDAAIPGHKHLSNWNDYAFDCPEGTWTAKLEQMAWGKSTNLILCFADVATGKQYRLSVFSGG
jgi:hypothetical protein